jgi:hypothetical protein
MSQVVELDEEGGVTSSQEVPTALIHKGDLLKVCVMCVTWGDMGRLACLLVAPAQLYKSLSEYLAG